MLCVVQPYTNLHTLFFSWCVHMSRRSNAKADASARKQRGLTERLFLLNNDKYESKIEYDVEGTTGNVYMITFAKDPYVISRWKCTCPDFKRRQLTCKHMYFVQARVLGMSDEAMQAETLVPPPPVNGNGEPNEAPKHRNAIWVLATKRLRKPYDATAQAPPEVIREYKQVVKGEAEPVVPPQAENKNPYGQREYVGELCAVCYEAMTAAEPVVFCHKRMESVSAVGCGNSLHVLCFERWKASQERQNRDVTCPHCRAPWFDPQKNKTKKRKRGANDDGNGMGGSYVRLSSHNAAEHADESQGDWEEDN